MTLKGLKYYLKNPRKWWTFLADRGLLNWASDEQYIRWMYMSNFGKKPDLKNPKTFNEKLQWLKLHDRKPIYTTMVDKYEAKHYIAGIIGEEYIIPTLGVWDSFDEIDFDSLPNQFVLKCTHDSGGLVICKDKSKLDVEKARRKIERSLRNNYYLHGREWPYKDVKRRIIAEQFMEDSSADALMDYKFFCFHGEPKIMYISNDHGVDPRTDFFDMDFNHLPIQARDPNADVPPEKPKHFDEMKRLAAILSKDMLHLRVDFYYINEKIYIGELTFYHMSGLTEFKPPEWNAKMAEWLQLPIKKNGKV